MSSLIKTPLFSTAKIDFDVPAIMKIDGIVLIRQAVKGKSSMYGRGYFVVAWIQKLELHALAIPHSDYSAPINLN